MRFRNQFIADFKKNDVYGCIAICYKELKYYLPKAGKGFVAQEIDKLKRSAELTELAGRFENLRYDFLKIVQSFEENLEENFDTLKYKIVNRFQEFQYSKEVDRKKTIAICLFYIIEALDTYVNNYVNYIQEYGEWLQNGCGPLNKGNSGKTYMVYLKPRQSFLDNAYLQEKVIRFRKRLMPMNLGDVFPSIQIIGKDQLIKHAGIPQIIHVPLNEQCKRMINEKKMFRISAIPYIGFDTFRFHEVDRKDPCLPKESPVGSFYIDYIHEYENDNMKLVISLLDTAIQSRANFIVFPEFIMSNKMLESISKHLKELEPYRREQLCLVFAGTTYEKNQEKGDNVLHILNAMGTEIASYYKYSPFQTEEARGASENISDKCNTPVIFQNMELLSNRGKKCNLLDVEIIGRILPGICRDIVDGEYTSELVKLFAPTLLFVPAWSTSVASFDTFFTHYADTVHTTSLLCNCCNAVGYFNEKEKNETSKETIIGKFCMPEKVGTIMKSSPKGLIRSGICYKNCTELQGCIINIDIDFSKGIPETQICKNIHPNLE